MGAKVMKDDTERAREIGGRLLQDKVWAEARQRFLNDATQQDFEDHLIRVAGEQAALLAFAQRPEGWVLVPKQPTDAMYEAAASSWDGALSTFWALAMWSAMLDVAPIPGEEK